MTHVVFLSIVFRYGTSRGKLSCLHKLWGPGLRDVLFKEVLRRWSFNYSYVRPPPLLPSQHWAVMQKCKNASRNPQSNQFSSDQLTKQDMELSLLCLFEISRSRNFWSIAYLWIIVQCQYCVTEDRYKSVDCGWINIYLINGKICLSSLPTLSLRQQCNKFSNAAPSPPRPQTQLKPEETLSINILRFIQINIESS